MSKMQQWVAFAAVGILAILAAGWFVVVTPQRKHASELRVKTAAENSQSAGLRTQLNVLVAQSKQLPAKQAELVKFGKQIPSTPALPALIRVLSDAAATADVDLVSIAPGPPAAYVSAVAPAQTVPTATAKSTTATGTVAPAKAPTATTLAAPGAATATAGLQTVPLEMKVTGTYAQIEQFVANLEGLQRVLLVNGFSFGPSAGAVKATSAGTTAPVGCSNNPCVLDLDLTGHVFVAPTLVAPVTPTVK